MGLKETEAECAEGRTAPRVSLADIEGAIAAEYRFTASDAIRALGMPDVPDLDLLSICILKMANGFMVIGKSAPVSAANFDADLGRKLAYEDAVRQLWPLMGYALRDRLADLAKNVPASRWLGSDGDSNAG